MEDRSFFQYSDYYFMFQKKNITKFGYDYFYDVTDELANIIEMKHKSPSSLILYYFNKFNNENSRYRYSRDRQIAPIKYPEKITSKKVPKMVDIFEGIGKPLGEEWGKYFSIDYSDRYKKLKGVEFSRIVGFNNIINKYYRIAENSVRSKMDLPNINEGWISETELFYKIKKSLHPLKVLQHARLKFLGRQHLDIFIPYLSLGIEYQGKQHFEPVDFFGGIETFNQTIERDERKLKLCRENGVELIYVEEGYDYNELLEIIRSFRKKLH